mgnify:CR=1 FL=1
MKNVIITGASGGIGKELALHFAKNNWNVIATMLCLEQGKELKELKNIHCYLLDVTSTESISAAKQQILEDFKTIDVVINNAGIGYRSFVEFSEDEEINNIVDVNWLGVVKVCRAFTPVFRMQKKGHTVQFGNTPSNFQKNVSKCDATPLKCYNELMHKISGIVEGKTKKNVDLKQSIVEKVLKIAENPPKKFKRNTIGFDANALNILRNFLGYQIFGRIIRYSVFK